MATNVYQADVSDTEQSDDLEGRSTDAASPQGEEESYYSEEENKIVFGGFVGIESFCTCCQGAFPSKSLLYNYLKTCKILDLIRPTIAAHSQSPVLMLESNALVTGLETRFGSRGWSYISISISLKGRILPSNAGLDANARLDTWCRVTLIN